MYDRPEVLFVPGRGVTMRNINLSVEKSVCGECSLALRRFIGNLDGVADIEIGNGRISIAFDESRIPEDRLIDISRNCIERLGYRVEVEKADSS